jgi:hypothetical protein
MNTATVMPLHIPGYDSLDEQQRAVIAWQYRTCGDFKRALWSAISYADPDNLERLRLAFPVEVEGYINFTSTPGWWRNTVEVAGGDVKAGY